MLKKNVLKEIHSQLEYDLDYVEEQSGYDSESFFASRHWSQIKNNLRNTIQAVEKELLKSLPPRKINRNI